MPEFFVDGVPHHYTNEGANVLATCLSLGFDLPYFCWHPALNSVGACRQCAIKVFKDENDTRGRLVMGCMTPIAPGLRISIMHPEAVAFRAGVTEWLMVNHPHDCPICDEGGECHLQDMTVMTGHNYRRYHFTKRTHVNQNLGPFLNHEMNRCIQCYRCVRFYNDFAGGKDFGVFSWHDHVYFGRAEEGTLESEFSGNLVEVCPTGVFTDKSLKRHYTRSWDMETSASVCEHCGLGCNTIPGEREGILRRIRSRYNPDVNGYFICDRGRYGYEYVNSPERVTEPLARTQSGRLEAVSASEALSRAADLIRRGKVIGIGSPRASLESNYALQALVGAGRYYQGVPERELRLLRLIRSILETGNAPGASMQEAAKSDAVLVLGEDVTNSAPLLALSLRQAALRAPEQAARAEIVGGIHVWDDAAVREAVQSDRGSFFVATPAATKLDELCDEPDRAAPDDLARLAFQVAHEIDGRSPRVADLGEHAAARARRIAAALKAAAHPVVVCGTSCESEELLQAAANVAWALRAAGVDVRICFTVGEANSMGASMLEGAGLEAAIEAVGKGDADTVIILENDLARRLPREALDRLYGRKTKTIAVDHISNSTVERAEVVLPAATVPEGNGTLVNNEGRAQRFVQVFLPKGEIKESWRWLGLLHGERSGSQAAAWVNLDAVQAALAASSPHFKAVPELAPPADYKSVGQRIPRMPLRASGRTALVANRTVHEPPPPRDENNPMSFSMEGFPGMPPAALLSRYWAPGWNSVQALNKFQIEVAGLLKGGAIGRLLIGGERAGSQGDGRSGAGPAYFERIPAAFAAREAEWLLVPAWHIYGSEELSVHSPGVRELAARPYLGLSPADAARIQVTEGQTVIVTLNGEELRLPATLKPGCASGVALYPAGLSGASLVALPAWVKLKAGPLPAPGGVPAGAARTGGSPRSSEGAQA